jgi:hypothetical protein
LQSPILFLDCAFTFSVASFNLGLIIQYFVCYSLAPRVGNLLPLRHSPVNIHEFVWCTQKELEAAEKRVKELKDDLAAVQFTPHSKHGKLLMAKCRTLQEENTEIGREASEGKVS